jgi:RND family efflux transporter MFP subunit
MRHNAHTVNLPSPAALLGATLLILASFLASSGCERRGEAGQQPLSAVTVARPAQREVIEWDEYTGNLDAPEHVDLRARVSGEITDAPFKEGAIIKKDQLLFQIDVRPYQADLDAKQATQAQNEAQLALAKITLRRFEQAAPGAAVSQQELDIAKANAQQAEAVVAAAKAAVKVAQLNVDWCRVISPINGRVSRKYVTSGNLVTAGGGLSPGTLLTTINSIDPIYHYVSVDERSVLKYRRLSAEGKRISAREQQIPCFMQLLNETGFPHQGVVDFVDNRIDPTTGTLQARGVFPNKDGYLTPGSFGRVRVAGSGRYTTLLVPDVAIVADQSLKILLTVDADGIVHAHPVKPGALFGNLRSIEEGIGPDDRVIINGQIKARPGAKVAAKEVALDTSSIELTAPGSPTTQALPATRPFEPMKAPASAPATRPAATEAP